ncbi:MAG: caspase domain-containing protein [Rhizobiaceae bacterium]
MHRSIVQQLAAVLAGVAILLAGLASAAEARTNYALIVGVTKYPHLKEKFWLVGPDNDAELVRSYLTEHANFDPANVIVLADGVEGATTPTLANIRNAMAELKQKIRASSDDDAFVYLHFSGHGSQMPAVGEDSENDGKDEVFLPADTKKWDRQLNGFPNAYVDDDIGKDISALRDAGAFVWAVFDACHSASATRAAMGDGIEVSRRLDPTEIGAPEDVIFAATRSLAPTGERENPVEGADGEKGGLVAFFAAQTVETTPEMPLPRGAEDRTRYGLFTYTLFESLAKNPGISYRQLGQTILQAYSGMNRRAPTPLFEGELDARIFGATGEDPIVQWRVKVKGKRASVEAGRMHRLVKGTKLALLENAADPVEKAIGYLEVKSAKALKSTLVPVAHNGLEKPGEEVLAKGNWVRPVEFAIGFELVVARAAGGGQTEAINAAIERLAADDNQLFRIKVVDADDDADIALTVASDADIMERMGSDARIAFDKTAGDTRDALSHEARLWFLPSSGEASLLPGRRPPSMQLNGVADDEIDGRLASRLTKIFRATNLARMTAASDFKGKVELEFLILRDGEDDFEPIEAGNVPFVSQDDQIHLRIANKSSRAVDLNVLHIGTDYEISAVEPIRVERRGEEELGLFLVNVETLGVERLVAVITEALPGTDIQDLRFLSQGGVRSAETTKGVGEDEGIVGMLNAMGKQAATRGASSLSASKGAKGAVMIFPIETVELN